MVVCESDAQISEDSFFCPRFFCIPVVKREKNYPHG